MTRLPIQRLATASALYGFSAATTKALALLTVPFLTRALGADGYGLADLATSTAAVLTLAAQFSGDIPAARLAAIQDDVGRRRSVLASYVWSTAVVSLILALALIPAATIIATVIWAAPPDRAGLATLSLLLVPLSAVQAALTQLQRLRSRPGAYALLSAVDLLAQLFLAVFFVWLGLGPIGVVLGFVVGSMIGLLASAVAALDVVRVRASLAFGRSLFAQGLSFLPYLGAFVAADWMVRAILANAAGPAEVGAFGVAVRVASLMTLVGTAFAMAWGPYGLSLAKSAETAGIFRTAVWLYGGSTLGLAAIVAGIGPELTALIAGPGFRDAALMLPGLVVAAAFGGIEYILVIAAGVTDAGKRVAVAAIAGAGVQVIAAWVLVSVIGADGVGPAAVLGRLVSFALLLYALRAFLTIPRRLILIGAAIGIAVAALTQAAVAYELTATRATVLSLGVIGGLWFLVRALRTGQTPETT